MKLGVLCFGALAFVGCSQSGATGWDTSSYWKQAETTAHAWQQDAELVLLIADATDAKGIAHLEAPSARLRFEYRSQVDLAKTAAEQVGVSAGRPANCLFASYIHDKRTQLSTGMRTGDCAGPRLGPVKCSIVQIWKRAIAKGSPTVGVANIEMHLSDTVRRWRFTKTDHGLVDETFDDNC